MQQHSGSECCSEHWSLARWEWDTMQTETERQKMPLIPWLTIKHLKLQSAQLRAATVWVYEGKHLSVTKVFIYATSTNTIINHPAQCAARWHVFLYESLVLSRRWGEGSRGEAAWYHDRSDLNEPVGINKMLSCVIFNPHTSISMVRIVKLIIVIHV